MPVSEAQRRAKQKYNDKTYDTLRIRPRIEDAERIRAHAEARGESLTHFMLRAAASQMKIDEDGE
jgi:uncharacterized protein (DUF1778 family)